MGEERSQRWSWLRLVWLAPVLLGATFLLVMVIVLREIEPFFLTIIVILFVTGYVGRRFPRRAGPITVLVVLLLLLLINVVGLIGDLAHPESALNFIAFGLIPVTLVVAGVISSIAVLTSRRDNAASAVAYGAAIIVLVGAVVGIIAALGLEDDTAVAGDIQIVAEEVEFTPDALSAAGGSVGVFVDNKDPVRHTFTIEALDISVELPANTARRVDVNAPPGTYEFKCLVPGHETMKGMLTLGS
ncbi:MAG: hypothetical protein BMS9Abin07_1308 [Acidimicrobiia bacterium]|nr:MAG: hypothetical protein BMS9Abin07_1308 [Acidimicrobiia bacterium]